MRYRRLRVQDLIREEISTIIQRDVKDPGMGFITILEIKMSDDLRRAKVFCSIYGGEETKEKTLAALKRSKGFIRHLLGERVKLRYTPEITFTLDNTLETVAKIEEILRKEEHVQED